MATIILAFEAVCGITIYIYVHFQTVKEYIKTLQDNNNVYNTTAWNAGEPSLTHQARSSSFW